MTCGSVTVEGLASPVTVTGLSGDAEFTCTVVATNATGSSSSSTGVAGFPGGEPVGAGLNIILIKAAIDAQSE